MRDVRIAIVDDDANDLRHLRDVLETYADPRNIEMEIDAFSSGSAFIRDFQPGKYEMIFFDNYIGKGLGIDFARIVRTQDEEVEIVFVSMSPEFAVSGFEVRALHYLIKPATPEAIEGVFERIWKHTPKVEDTMIEVIFERHPLLISARSIRYIEVVNRTCYIYGEKECQTHVPLKKLLETLPPGEFIRTHSSFAVRLSCIRTMDKTDFILDDGKAIPIGRAFSDCKSAYIEYLTNRNKR